MWHVPGNCLISKLFAFRVKHIFFFCLAQIHLLLFRSFFHIYQQINEIFMKCRNIKKEFSGYAVQKINLAYYGGTQNYHRMSLYKYLYR